MKSITDLKTEIINILNTGLVEKLITSSDYDKALTTFDEFNQAHPDYIFLSPKEKKEQTGNSDEQMLWQSIQPILDKAQNVQPLSRDEAERELKLAREESPLKRSDFTSAELERLKVLAPEEYKNVLPHLN